MERRWGKGFDVLFHLSNKAEWHITLRPHVVKNVLHKWGWGVGGGWVGGTKDSPQPLTLSLIDNHLFMCKTHINFID